VPRQRGQGEVYLSGEGFTSGCELVPVSEFPPACPLPAAHRLVPAGSGRDGKTPRRPGLLLRPNQTPPAPGVLLPQTERRRRPSRFVLRCVTPRPSSGSGAPRTLKLPPGAKAPRASSRGFRRRPAYQYRPDAAASTGEPGARQPRRPEGCEPTAPPP